MAVLIILIILFLAGVLWILRPLVLPPDVDALAGISSQSDATPDQQTTDPQIIEQLIDLEYDFHTGKISEDEYRRLRSEIMRQA